MTTSRRTQEVQELFLPAGEREQFINKHSINDLELRTEDENLLIDEFGTDDYRSFIVLSWAFTE